jgi:hypothetical protein
MAVHNRTSFANQDVELDGNTFEACSFTNCRLVYRGGQPPTLIHSLVDPHCVWTMKDEAANTMKLLQSLHAHGHSQVVQNVFDKITGRSSQPTPGHASSTVTIQ